MILALIVATGIVLSAWGVVANFTVVAANNGVMPVISSRPGFIIDTGGTPRRFVPNGKLLFLADRVRIDFPDWEKHIPGGSVGQAINWWGKWLEYPFDGGIYIVSIGDIFRWSGSILFLIGNIFLIPLTLWRIYKGALPRIFKK